VTQASHAEIVARAVVGRRTGLFQRFHALPRDADDAGVREVVGVPAAYGVLPGGGAIGAPGGRGVRVSDAWPYALFEAIERYCPAFVDERRVVHRAAGDDPRFLCGPALPRFSAGQYASPDFPFAAVGADAPLPWVEGRSLVDDAARFVPAPLVYMPWRPRTRAELVGPNLSTGTACGPTWEWACLTGLLEVCERDAFAITWLARMSMPRLVPRRGTRVAARVAALLAPGARVDFVDLTNDLRAPVVLAVHRQALRGRPIVTVGAAACASRARAATKALFEAARQYTRIRELAGSEGAPAWRPRPDFADVVEFEHHSLVYADPALQPHLGFLTASPIELPLFDDDDAPRDAGFLRRLVAAVAAAGEDVVAVDLTTRDVAELGLCVVKVFVPGAVPLAADHRYPLLGSRRLDQVPARLGLRPIAASELNLAVPHPFA
jgi:ribosomal protein S12 methylthiotransferase accessory factor